MSKKLFFLIGFVFLAVTVFPDVKLPGIFGDHMVFQRDERIRIWGKADPGEEVSVSLGSRKASTRAGKDGNWMVELEPMKAVSKPLKLVVQGKNRIVLEDVLVGEVWLCSGQSNMEMGIKLCLNAKKEIAEANHPGIRLFDSPRATSPVPLRDVNAKWRVCTPENITYDGWGGFSGAAYFFGRKLHEELGVPIGLVEASWGGSKIEAWIPPRAFSKVKALEKIWRFVEKTVPGSPAWENALKKTMIDVEKWLRDAGVALAEKRYVRPLPSMDFYLPQGNHGISGLYNAMIHPLVPFGIRGVIWYQGEANNGDRMLYKEKMKALIYGWRDLWKKNFPFYYVQIAPYRYRGRKAKELPYLWEAQLAALEIGNTGMAQTQDIGNPRDIHPKNKQEVGRRLALIALAKTYGKKGIVFFGPTFERVERAGDKLRVYFKNVGSGLASRDGQPLSWFEIAGRNGRFVAASAEIEGKNSVVVRSGKVREPVWVRFGWSEIAEPNLMNKEGFPAYPFRASVARKL